MRLVRQIRAAQTLDELYALLPKVECKGLCQKSCGPIGMSKIEQERIIERHGSLPAIDDSFSCSKLEKGRCSIYPDRPMICRLWGSVSSVSLPMHCPHNCAKRMMSDAEGTACLTRARELSTMKDEQASGTE